MSPTDSLVSLVSALTFKRWFALVAIIFTVCACLWVADSYVGYSKYYRTERAIGFIEKLGALEQKSTVSPELAAVRGKAIEHVSALLDSERPAQEAGEAAGYVHWMKFASGALPWLLITLSGLSALSKKKEKNILGSFLVAQIFTVTFGFVNQYLTPTTGIFWIDHIAIPWGVCVGFIVICIIIPAAILLVAAFKKMNEANQRIAITNNLRQLAAAADQFYLETGTTQTTYDQLVGSEKTKYIRHIQPVDGERYDLIEFKQGQPLQVTRRSGALVRYDGAQ